MKSTRTVSSLPQSVASGDFLHGSLQGDVRWRLAQRVVSAQQFARAPLLSKFLLYVVAETLNGRQNAISEHRIGVNVFGRALEYRTSKDNIVRSYARYLRERLAEYFAGPGCGDSMRIHIPLGNYVPLFISAPKDGFKTGIASKTDTGFVSSVDRHDRAGVEPRRNGAPRSAAAPALRVKHSLVRGNVRFRIPAALAITVIFRNSSRRPHRGLNKATIIARPR